jgi:hypothetical protein
MKTYELNTLMVQGECTLLIGWLMQLAANRGVELRSTDGRGRLSPHECLSQLHHSPPRFLS